MGNLCCPQANYVDVELQKGRTFSTVSAWDEPPKVHVDLTLDHTKKVNMEQHETLLKDCTDERLLAEVEQRGIRVQDQAESKSKIEDVSQRSVPLYKCSNDLLQAEVAHRNIRLHEKVSKDLVTSRYKFGKPLGQGSSAMVYLAKHRRTQSEVAIKVIQRNDDMNDDESMATELEILKTVHHRYILNCLELFETPDCIWVVMEVIRGGELLEILIDGGIYSEKDASRAMKQAFLAVSYLHSQGVVHRDLKLQNLLLSTKERTSDLKVADFGLSARLPRDTTGRWGDKDFVKAYDKLVDKWGTPQYFAPEMLKKRYGPQVDVWALGVVLFQLLVGRLPFNAGSNAQLFRQIENSPDHLRKLFRMNEWNSVSGPAKDLVEKLLHPDPRQRLNADEALAHEWIALKGHTGPQHHLKGAQQALRQQLAQKRLTAMWHVLDIINALDEQPASRQLSPALQKHASNVSKANFGQAPGVLDRVGQSKGADPEAPPDGARDRLNSTTDRIEELQNLFSIFDTDGNGTIDQDEIAALFRKLGFEPSPFKLRALMDEVDANKNGELEFSEFCEFLKLAKSGERGLGFGDAIAGELASYTNANGYINNEDLGRFLQAFSGGQTLSQAEIDDVLALAGENAGQSDGNLRPTDIAKALISSKMSISDSAPNFALLSGKHQEPILVQGAVIS